MRNLRVKEREVARYVKQVFAKQHSIVVDESVGPSRRRPDLLIKINALRVIVEVDERQHGSYDKTAEQQRVEDLKRDLNAPLVLIRFNPDAYRTAEGLQHGCFSLDRATKRLYVSNYAEWVERLKVLRVTIENARDSAREAIESGFREVKLFFSSIKNKEIS